MKKLKGAKTTLERSVQATINRLAADYNSGAKGVLTDLMQGGCQSGMIGSLIYYTDTVKFYKRHAKEIDALLADLCQDSGLSPAELFGDKWDSSDPLARETLNQNLLAWFGFEETARNLASRNDIDI